MDNIYFLKLLNIISTTNISLWRRTEFSIRLITNLLHFIRNSTYMLINRNDHKVLHVHFIQTIGLIFDILTSFKESGINKYFKYGENITQISDGWVGLFGTLAAVFESFAMVESLSIENINFISNNS